MVYICVLVSLCGTLSSVALQHTVVRITWRVCPSVCNEVLKPLKHKEDIIAWFNAFNREATGQRYG